MRSLLRALAGSSEPLAIVAGRLYWDLAECTTDLRRVDTPGQWILLWPYSGPRMGLRFTRQATVDPRDADDWAPRLGPVASSLTRDAFVAAVESIRRDIECGTYYQVNLTRRLSAGLSGPRRLVGLWARLARMHDAPYLSALSAPELGVELVCASPECFLARDGTSVRTMPIKGTAATGEDFLPKDFAENAMIVDLLRNDLNRVCRVGTVHVPAAFVREEHPGLSHLVSTVAGELREDCGFGELLDATFPPGSVTGAPKKTAVEAIARLEPVERGVYCGAFGLVDGERRVGELALTIRTFFLAEEQLCFGTGAGITYASDPEGEWRETELKARRLGSLAGY